MSESLLDLDSWSPSVQRRVDKVCMRFEEAWRGGAPPQLETYLDELDDTARPLLLQELVALELTYRCRQGDIPQVQEYASRFPELEAQLPPLFSEIVTPTADYVPGNGKATQVHHRALTLQQDQRTSATGVGPWPTVAGYEILQELGRGGMGVVYRARQLQAKRDVALKMVLVGAHASPEQLARFRWECEALARLHHPNVVQIFDVGESDGLPFFSMELMAGGSLAKRLRDKTLSPTQAAQLTEKLALALDAIHDRQLVHRDLKPGNVLLEGSPETPLEHCVPKVSDFGLAKPLDRDFQLSQTGQVLGTLAYMAPEQADPRFSTVGPWTDLYALGAILYELLTGKPPFKGGTNEESKRQVLRLEPVFPQPGRSRLERDLQTICLKCLEKSPAQRYRSGAEVAERLRRVLEDRPIPERPPGLRERTQRLVWRYPLLVGLLLLVLGASGGIASFTQWSNYWSDPQRVREHLESRLAAGDAVTLIGDEGPPGYYQWGAGETETLASTSPKRPFSLSTIELAQVNFPYAAHLRRYRFRAQVRHDRGAGLSSVGIYCCRKEYSNRNSLASSSFICLHCADSGGRVKLAETPQRSNVNCDFYYLEKKPHRSYSPHDGWGLSLPIVAALPMNEPAPWRELTLEVTPEYIRASWSPERGPQELICEVPTEKALFKAKGFQALLLDSQKEGNAPLPHLMAGVQPEIVGSGGLGLFVDSGTASFRRVVLEPLP